MPIPRRNPRDSLTRSPSDWTQLRSVDTERTTEARRSLFRRLTVVNFIHQTRVQAAPSWQTARCILWAERWASPARQRAAGKTPCQATHTAVPSPCALDRHPVTSLLWPQSLLFGLTPQYAPSPTVKPSVSLIYLKSSFIAFSRNWPA